MNIYIKSQNGFPATYPFMIAYWGFKQLGANIHFFENIKEVPFAKGNLVVSYKEDILRFWNETFGTFRMSNEGDCGIIFDNVPTPLHIPESMKKYCGRNVYDLILKRNQNPISYPCFMKIKSLFKTFEPVILQSEQDYEVLVNNFPMYLTQCSDVVNFVSEYRCFIIDGKLKSVDFYKGDFKIMPDSKIIENAISDYKEQPIAYCMDFGVTDKGETLLVECNDGWGVGCYGTEPTLYANVLFKRWQEIVNPEFKLYEGGAISITIDTSDKSDKIVPNETHNKRPLIKRYLNGEWVKMREFTVIGFLLIFCWYGIKTIYEDYNKIYPVVAAFSHNNLAMDCLGKEIKTLRLTQKIK